MLWPIQASGATTTPPSVPRTVTRISLPSRTVRSYCAEISGATLFTVRVSSERCRTLLERSTGTPPDVSAPSLITPYVIDRDSSDRASAVDQHQPSGSSISPVTSGAAGSLYFFFQRSSVGGLPFAFSFSSSASSQRRRRSARMRFSSSEAGSCGPRRAPARPQWAPDAPRRLPAAPTPGSASGCAAHAPGPRRRRRAERGTSRGPP